jgi:hypothetical protein
VAVVHRFDCIYYKSCVVFKNIGLQERGLSDLQTSINHFQREIDDYENKEKELKR